MMDITDTIEGVRSALSDKLSAEVAYGEPITADGITIIPVARVMMGFGAGGGVGEAEHSGNGEEAPAPVGGGGGGGGLVQPLGFIEIDSTGARWVALEPSKAEVALRALMMGAVLLPFGGRRGLIGRFILLIIGQVIAGRISQPNLPSMDSFRSRVSV
jgi:uncharacterized spore protein YtfJ